MSFEDASITKVRTVRDIFNEFDEYQSNVAYAIIGQLLDNGVVDFDELGDEARITYRYFTNEQKRVINMLICEAAKF